MYIPLARGTSRYSGSLEFYHLVGYCMETIVIVVVEWKGGGASRAE